MQELGKEPAPPPAPVAPEPEPDEDEEAEDMTEGQDDETDTTE